MKYSKPGIYEVFFDIMKEPEGCEYSLWQRQKQVSDFVSTFNETEVRETDLYICDIKIPESEKTLTLRFKTDRK